MGKRVPEITVILTYRRFEDCGIALQSLQNQTFQDFVIMKVEDEEGRGASWVRNEGIRRMKDIQRISPFILFSDNDINWYDHALETLYKTLNRTPKASYAYGRYKKGNGVYSHMPFSAKVLKETNYISTMSLIRTEHFPKEGFDENIRRLNDWELFLRMLLVYGRRGVYCNDIIFETEPYKEGKPSITNMDDFEYMEAIDKIRAKYKLPHPEWDVRRFFINVRDPDGKHKMA